MDEPNRELFKLKAQVAKALAHESRLLILDALKDGDLCVGDLAERLKAEQPTVSKHLSVLKNVGIVSDRKDGNKIYYHLETPCVLAFFNCALEVMNQREKRFRVVGLGPEGEGE